MSAPPRLKGSKPTSPGSVPSRSLGRGRKGSDWDISLLVSAASEVVVRPEFEGAKAAVVPMRVVASAIFIIIVCYCSCSGGNANTIMSTI